MERLEQTKYYRSFETGQTVVWAGDKMDFVGSVVKGIATLNQTLEDGRTQMVGLLLPSDFVGRPGRASAAYDVMATTDLVMCCFRKKPFEEIMAATPRIGERLLEMTLDELDAAREWMVVLGRKSTREKLASMLLIFARRNATLNLADFTGTMAFDLPLTRQEMANYLGVTHETVSRQVTALKQDGVIQLESNRRFIVPDFERLLAEAGDESDREQVG